jgi:hypothetical protein
MTTETSRLLKKGVGGVASAAGPDARRRDEGDAGAHRRGAPRLSAAAVALRPAAERFQKPPGARPPFLTLSAAVREANACGRKLDTTPASIFQQPAKCA